MTNIGVGLEIRHVKKAFPVYGSKELFYAVNGIDLSVQAGHLVTLLGPSGCGKTTMLRMVAGFEIPTEGLIVLGGRDVTSIPPNKRNIGMMFQSYALFPHLDVWENIAYGLKIQHIPETEVKKRVGEMLDLMRISEYANRMPNQISGGQQQRVALARAIVTKPQVLLFDEPLSNLDAKLREYMRDELRRIQTEIGTTSLYVTHDQSEAMAISDQVVIMRNGQIEQHGTNQDIYSNPCNRFVANFMGKANFISISSVEKETENRAVADILGQRLAITCTAGFTSGVCLIRPEDIHFDEHGPFKARVVHASYFGNMIEYELAIGNIHLSMTEFGNTSVIAPTGSIVSLRFATDKLRLVPDDKER